MLQELSSIVSLLLKTDTLNAKVEVNDNLLVKFKALSN